MSILFGNITVGGATDGAGVTSRAAVRCTTTDSIIIDTVLVAGGTIDGITLATGNRVLVKNQISQPETTVVTLTDGVNFTAVGTGDYFTIYSGGDATTYVFWFNVTTGATSSPAVGGATNVQVDISAIDNAAAVAAALKTAVDIYPGDFTTSILADSVTITATVSAETTDATGPNMPAETSITINEHGSTAISNGVYEIQSSGPPTRTEDFDPDQPVGSSMIIVQEGTTWAETMWLCINNLGSDTVGVDELYFINVGGTANAKRVAYAIMDDYVEVDNESYINIGYFTWDAGRYADYSDGKCVYYYDASTGGADLTLQLWNLTTSTEIAIDSDVSGSGIRTLDFAVAGGNAQIAIRVLRTGENMSTHPIVTGVQLEFYDGSFGGQILSNASYTRTEVTTSTFRPNENEDILGVTRTTVEPVTIILPDISDLPNGKMKLTIVDEGGNASNNNITIEVDFDDTIMGSNSIVISGDYDAVTLYSDGDSTWFIM